MKVALTRPVLYTTPAFDAGQSHVFQFSSSGGSSPITANTLTIRNNTTLAVVYSEIQTTFQYTHTLPAGTLTNGTYYTASIVTHDAQGNSSVESNSIQFYCYSTPSIVLTNMPTGNVINNASFAFNAQYTQAQGELLNAYTFNLYNTSGTLVATSGTQYTTQSSLPIIVAYTFNGFEDNTQYEIEVTGVTIHGMQVSTGRVEFSVQYTIPELFSELVVQNNCEGGYITIRSNIAGILGTSNPSPPVYIDDTEVDLRESGSYVEWTEGYRLSGNWTANFWGRAFTPDSIIAQFNASDGSTIYVYYIEEDGQCWVEIRVLMFGLVFGYTTQSNVIVIPADNEQLYIFLRNIDNIYEVQIQNRGVIA